MALQCVTQELFFLLSYFFFRCVKRALGAQKTRQQSLIQNPLFSHAFL